jgi:hypothetical protein
MLGLIALAFGEHASAAVARALIYAALIVLALLAIDIMTHGALSMWI